jgi:hypothetical protein
MGQTANYGQGPRHSKTSSRHDTDCADPAAATRLTGDPVELHRQLALFERSTCVSQTKHDQRAWHRKAKGRNDQNRAVAETKSDEFQFDPFPASAQRRLHRFNSKTILSSPRQET